MSGTRSRVKGEIMRAEILDTARVLDVAARMVTEGGFSAMTLRTLAQAADVPYRSLVREFGTIGEALVLMLNREFTGIYVEIVDHVERDPRGGLLSRIYYYTLAAAYERPLAKTLYMIDREALNAIMRTANSYGYVPGIGIRTHFIEAMKTAGMVRAEVDAETVSTMIMTFSAGLALTAPHDDLDRTVSGMTDLLARVVDADVDDTSPGKAAFYEWAMSLATTR